MIEWLYAQVEEAPNLVNTWCSETTANIFAKVRNAFALRPALVLA